MDESPMSLLQEIAEKLYDGDDQAVAELVQSALDEGLEAGEVLENGLLAGMDRVSDDFRDDILFVPEVLVAARAMHAGMDVLRPFLSSGDIKLAGKVMIGTVEGDLHDIGKNLVAMMLEGNGFEVIDLGTDVPPDAIVEAIQKEEPDILGLSALLTTTMASMKRTVETLTEAGVRDKVMVIIGGAPVTHEFANEIGADGYAPDAGSATDLVKDLLS
jgi:corrinoid protein of di/trimethylamine methyltransferase